MPHPEATALRGGIDVVIPSYGTRDRTVRAVDSALAQPETRQVLVADNASPDDSVAFLEARFAAPAVRVLRSDENRGFGAACNAGAAAASAPLLCFLNSDAVFEPNCLGILAARLDRDPHTGIVAPAVRTPEGGLQPDAQGAFPSAWSLLARSRSWQPEALEPDWVSGVAFAVRRDEFLKLGGFDPAFFMYYEDVDLCRRYRAAGYRVGRELHAAVTHAGGASRTSRPLQRAQSDRSQDLWLERRGTPSWQRWLVRAARRTWRRIGD
jgi:GT2 family glycosyltransferase